MSLQNVESLKPTGLFTNYIYKAIPLVFDESMSYYETLLGLLAYLKNTVIPTVNNNADAVIELQNLYNQLHDYVENYFNNLDVQQEINNKLDDMTQNGTLTNIIKTYVDPIYQAYENNINNQIQNINSKVSTLQSGSPAGVFDSLSDLQSADPDHSKIYLVKSNGDWYYYNDNSSSWESGGTYQSMIIPDNYINPIMTTFLKNNQDNLLYIPNGTYSGITMSQQLDGLISASGTVTVGTPQDRTFASYYLKQGNLFLMNTGNSPFCSIYNSNYSKRIAVIIQSNNQVVNIPSDGIYHLSFEGINSLNFNGYVLFTQNQLSQYSPPRFNNPYLKLLDDNFNPNLLSKINYPDTLFNSNPDNGFFNNKSHTNRLLHPYVINYDLRKNSSFLKKVVGYFMSDNINDAYCYVTTKNQDGNYDIITSSRFIISNNISQIDFNLDISQYDNIYLICNNVAYLLQNSSPGIGFSRVERDDNIFVPYDEDHPNGDVYLEIYTLIPNTAESLKSYSNKLYNLLKKDINPNPNYYKNLKNALYYDFYNLNNINELSLTNSQIQNNSLNCNDYTLTIMNKSCSLDYINIESEFTFNSNSTFGLFSGNMLGFINNSNNTINLGYNFNNNNVIPTTVTSNNLTINFVNGNKYILKFIKNAMNYTFSILDINSMTENSVTIDRIQNKGFGNAGIVTFSGSVNFNYIKYNTILYDFAKVLFLGDSTTEGVDVIDSSNRWCDKLAKNYFSNNAIISGVGGETTQQGYNRLNNILNLGYTFQIAIIYLGLNDIRTQSLANFKSYIPQIYNLCIQNNIHPIFTTPWKLQDYEEYAQQATEFLIEQGYDLIRFDLTNITVLHPNDSQQQILVDQAEKALNYYLPIYNI